MFAWLGNLFFAAAVTDATAGLRERLVAAESLLATKESTILILELERKHLLGVIERDRLRVEAESKILAGRIVDAEQGPAK